ncbi:MAG: o-succinylbenzoate synthase [Crocinitomicaceae bacterium]|nr:o-succinylbenzoate synthase [Crocinitomicaceae bacterium]
MLKASVEKITLQFKRPAGTSRGILSTKNSWIISLWNDEKPGITGKGEASIIESLSPEWSDEYENELRDILSNIHLFSEDDLINFPSIRFGIEAALKDLKNGGKREYFDNAFTRGEEGIRINGLIWMGDKSFMLDQIKEKLEMGFSCIKLKIGAIDFDAELDLLRFIRAKFSKETLELRVDANGAFAPKDALEKLEALSKFDLHSIEQPIKQRQWEEMAQLCKKTPLPIALDEELIGINEMSLKQQVLNTIKPQYIILKPSLVGGFTASDEWISLAEKMNIGWWITSALESNVGLDAIAQYTATKNNPMPQGLGTGQLFKNNVTSTLRIKRDFLFHH